MTAEHLKEIAERVRANTFTEEDVEDLQAEMDRLRQLPLRGHFTLPDGWEPIIRDRDIIPVTTDLWRDP